MADSKLSPAALKDLEGIWRYTVQQWGVTQASQYIDQLSEAFETIAQVPGMAPTCDHIRPGYRRLSVGRHVVYFRQDLNCVTIIRVLHERMDAPRHF